MPTIPIWLSLSIILGVLLIATVASLLKTRGEFVGRDEPVIEPEQADQVPITGPAAEAAAEPRIDPAQDGSGTAGREERGGAHRASTDR